MLAVADYLVTKSDQYLTYFKKLLQSPSGASMQPICAHLTAIGIPYHNF